MSKKTKSHSVNVCPECNEKVSQRLVRGSYIVCFSCQTELYVVSTHPVRLEISEVDYTNEDEYRFYDDDDESLQSLYDEYDLEY